MVTKMTYEEMEAAHAVVSIRNALLQLQVFKDKREAAIPMVLKMTNILADGGVEARDLWEFEFWVSLLGYLKTDCPGH
jgi:hypothetical protein